jgi:hypothetical protein
MKRPSTGRKKPRQVWGAANINFAAIKPSMPSNLLSELNVEEEEKTVKAAPEAPPTIVKPVAEAQPEVPQFQRG